MGGTAASYGTDHSSAEPGRRTSLVLRTIRRLQLAVKARHMTVFRVGNGTTDTE